LVSNLYTAAQYTLWAHPIENLLILLQKSILPHCNLPCTVPVYRRHECNSTSTIWYLIKYSSLTPASWTIIILSIMIKYNIILFACGRTYLTTTNVQFRSMVILSLITGDLSWCDLSWPVGITVFPTSQSNTYCILAVHASRITIIYIYKIPFDNNW